MNITLVNMARFNNVTGGLEKVFVDMANALSEDIGGNHSVTALIFDPVKGLPAYTFNPKVNFVNCISPLVPVILKTLGSL